jgi:hypothetical protein
MAAEPEIRVEPKPQLESKPVAAADETKVEFDGADDVQPDLLPPETEGQT